MSIVIKAAVLGTGLALSMPLAAANSLAVARVDASTPRNVQIRLAKSAAPRDITDHATVLVLGPRGYEVAQRGTNGFTCFLERWYLVDVAPQCMDAEGGRTTLKSRIYLERRRAQGVSEAVVKREIDAGYRSGRFLAPSRPGINYMHSPYIRLFVPQSGKVQTVPAHYMFYAPYATEAKTGREAQGGVTLVAPGRPDTYFLVAPGPQHQH